MKNAFLRGDKNNQFFWQVSEHVRVGGPINHARKLIELEQTFTQLTRRLEQEEGDRWSNRVDGFTNCFMLLSEFLWDTRRWTTNIIINVIYVALRWCLKLKLKVISWSLGLLVWTNLVGWSCIRRKLNFFCDNFSGRQTISRGFVHQFFNLFPCFSRSIIIAQ